MEPDDDAPVKTLQRGARQSIIALQEVGQQGLCARGHGHRHDGLLLVIAGGRTENTSNLSR